MKTKKNEWKLTYLQKLMKIYYEWINEWKQREKLKNETSKQASKQA